MKFVHVATRTKDLDEAIAFYEMLEPALLAQDRADGSKATLVFMEPAEGNFAIELVYNWGKDTPTTAASASATSPSGWTTWTPCCPSHRGRRHAGAPPYLLEGNGPRIAFVADPDGNWVELIQRNV